MTLPIVNSPIASLPIDILSHIATHHSNPSTFSVCSKRFATASQNSFRELAKQYKECEALKRINADLLPQVRISGGQPSYFQDIVKQVYLNTLRQVAAFPGGKKMIGFTRMAFKSGTINPQRLEQLACWTEAQHLVEFFRKVVSKRDAIKSDTLAPIEVVLNNRQTRNLTKAREIRNALADPKNRININTVNSIDLVFSKLKFIPPEIACFSKLEKLNLFWNELSSIPDQLWNLTRLKNIDLSRNKLQSVSLKIQNLTQLQTLNLEENQLQKFPLGITYLTQLTHLYLKTNQFESLPKEISRLTRLKFLDVANNLLETLPEEIGNLSQLEFLDFSDNPIQSLPATISTKTTHF